MRRRTASAAEQADQMLLSIGGVAGSVAFAGAPQPFVSLARTRYEAFTMPALPAVARAFALDLRFSTVRPGGAPRDLQQLETTLATKPLRVKVSGRAIHISRWDFDVRLTAGSGGARARWSGGGRCEMNPFALDSLLRVLWSILLPMQGGALLHACGLRHGEIGAVFPGVSEAGKTTLARKAPDADDVLSDEIVALSPADDSPSGWRVYGTPFWGDFKRGGISMRSWPLRCVGFLSQRDSVVMAPITSAEATLRLLSCFVCFQTDRETVTRNLAVATRLCADVRSVEAQLTRTAPTAEIFSKLIPHLGPEVRRKVPAHSAREMISEFRSLLRKNGRYTLRPKGAAVRSMLKGSDTLVIEATGSGELAPGDVLLSWVPGKTADDDALICRRHVSGGARAARGEVLGKVSAVARDGRAVPLSGRLDNLGRMFGAQVAPILRQAGR